MRFTPLFDGDGGAGGAGGGDANPAAPAVGDKTPAPTVTKFGNLEVDLSTPEGIAAAIKTYDNAVSFGEKKSRELAEATKVTKTPEVKTPEVKTPEVKNDPTLDFVAKQLTADGFDKLISKETQRLEEKYGDKFTNVKEDFLKTMNEGKTKLTLDKKQEFIVKGDLEGVFKNVFTKNMLEGDTTPKPNAENLGSKENQESLPGQPPAGIGVDPTPAPGIKPSEADYDFRNTAKKAKAARLAETNKGLSS